MFSHFLKKIIYLAIYGKNDEVQVWKKEMRASPRDTSSIMACTNSSI